MTEKKNSPKGKATCSISQGFNLGQRFPTFSVPWTLLTIWLKAVDLDPLIKPVKTLLRSVA